VDQDPIRLKNLLGRAEERLIESGLRAVEARALLAPARRLIDDASFWRSQADGLALFGDADGWRHYRLPARFDERLSVGGRFCIRPLLTLLAESSRFHVLAVSQKAVRLFTCNAHDIVEEDLGGLSREFAESFKYGDSDREEVQIHSSAGRRGAGSAVHHGQGGEMDKRGRKQAVAHRLERVDAAVHARLRGESAPLVVAGVDYLRALYRQANTYPHLIDEGVAGNPHILRPEELLGAAREAVRPHFEKRREDVATRYRQFAGTRLASGNIKDVLPAAHLGRVDSLFVTLDAGSRGRFDPATMAVTLDAADSHDSEDLLDLAAAHVFSNSGSVFAVSSERMPVPGRSPVAAIFRY
jgi:hypothetical protein